MSIEKGEGGAWAVTCDNCEREGAGVTNVRPVLLDLFCGAGGASAGYHRAGFDVVGVDIVKQPRYPFTFVQADALEYLAAEGQRYDAVRASPPCQGYSVSRGMSHVRARRGEVPLLIAETRAALVNNGKPWVIENVTGARPHLCDPIMLCGLTFGLKMFRHRLFECSFYIMQPSHLSHRHYRVGKDGFVCMSGHGDNNRGAVPLECRTAESWRAASGIDWMSRDELAQAIPPVYTAYIGSFLRRQLEEDGK